MPAQSSRTEKSVSRVMSSGREDVGGGVAREEEEGVVWSRECS